VQIKTTGSAAVRVNNIDATLSYVAKYAVSGKVVGVHDYTGRRTEDILSPRDVAIVWDWLAQPGGDSHINWGPFVPNDRAFSFSMLPNSGRTVMGYLSNNHVIPDSKETRKLINDIKEGDFIRIEGYLVNVSAEINQRRTFVWNTATSRDNFDCEIVYVTNVTWLHGP
jgi:hypothetical protein